MDRLFFLDMYDILRKKKFGRARNSRPASPDPELKQTKHIHTRPQIVNPNILTYINRKRKVSEPWPIME